MMQSTFLKQVIYGSFYLLILFGIGYGIYAALASVSTSCFDGRRNQNETGIDCGGPCVSCEIGKLSPIEITRVSIFPLDIGTISALIELKNPNTRYGASNFSYDVRLIGEDGSLIASFSRDSFIYAGEIKVIAETGLVVPQKETIRGETIISSTAWSASNEFEKPNIQTRDIRIEARSPGAQTVLSGIAVNQNPYALSALTLTAIVYGDGGAAAGVSKTFLQNIAPFDERSFQIVLPPVGAHIPLVDAVHIYPEAKR